MAADCQYCGKAKGRFYHRCDPRVVIAHSLQQRSNPVAVASIGREQELRGVGPDWANPDYGAYYATSINVYAAVKLRADNITRPPAVVYRRTMDADGKAPVDQSHPFAQLMRKVNPFWTRTDLLRATETYLCLWGAAFWALTKAGPASPPTEIWPMRPDRVRVVMDRGRYIKGFVYEHGSQKVPLLPEEVVWFRYFNPLEEAAGLAPLAPARLSADMASDALRFNRQTFKTGMLSSNLFIKMDESIVFDDDKANDFYRAWERRHSDVSKPGRPILGAGGMDAKNLGMSQKDMEFLASLRYGLEDIARAYSIPKELLQDHENATYANIDAAERMFWRNTEAPELAFIAETINEFLSPQFGPDLFVEFDLTTIDVLKPEENAERDQDREDVRTGIITINEARARRGLEPVAWGEEPPMLGGNPALSESEPASAPGGTPAGKRWRAPVLTPAFLQQVEAEHEKRLKANERSFHGLQRALFEAQRRDVLERVGRAAPKAISEKALGETIFDANEWLRRFKVDGAPLYARILVTAARQEIARYGFGIAFDVQARIVQDWLETRSTFWATRVNAETGRLLIAELQEGIALGESVRQMQDRVNRVFDLSTGLRSETIARTEVQSAVNRGALESYRQSGVVEGKRWLATEDDRTREAHAEADGQVVPLEAKFLVGGEQLDHPGDVSGSAGNTVNCRCTSVPIIDAHARAYPPARNGHQPKEGLQTSHA